MAAWRGSLPRPGRLDESNHDVPEGRQRVLPPASTRQHALVVLKVLAGAIVAAGRVEFSIQYGEACDVVRPGHADHGECVIPHIRRRVRIARGEQPEWIDTPKVLTVQAQNPPWLTRQGHRKRAPLAADRVPVRRQSVPY